MIDTSDTIEIILYKVLLHVKTLKTMHQNLKKKLRITMFKL